MRTPCAASQLDITIILVTIVMATKSFISENAFCTSSVYLGCQTIIQRKGDLKLFFLLFFASYFMEMFGKEPLFSQHDTVVAHLVEH